MFDKPCSICEGKGHLVKETKNKEGESLIEKITCEACQGTGSALMHMFNIQNRQLKDIQNHHNDILHELRKKRYEAFSDFKKNT
jgi:hypothetical protein